MTFRAYICAFLDTKLSNAPKPTVGPIRGHNVHIGHSGAVDS